MPPIVAFLLPYIFTSTATVTKVSKSILLEIFVGLHMLITNPHVRQIRCYLVTLISLDKTPTHLYHTDLLSALALAFTVIILVLIVLIRCHFEVDC